MGVCVRSKRPGASAPGRMIIQGCQWNPGVLRTGEDRVRNTTETRGGIGSGSLYGWHGYSSAGSRPLVPRAVKGERSSSTFKRTQGRNVASGDECTVPVPNRRIRAWSSRTRESGLPQLAPSNRWLHIRYSVESPCQVPPSARLPPEFGRDRALAAKNTVSRPLRGHEARRRLAGDSVFLGAGIRWVS